LSPPFEPQRPTLWRSADAHRSCMVLLTRLRPVFTCVPLNLIFSSPRFPARPLLCVTPSSSCLPAKYARRTFLCPRSIFSPQFLQLGNGQSGLMLPPSRNHEADPPFPFKGKVFKVFPLSVSVLPLSPFPPNFGSVFPAPLYLRLLRDFFDPLFFRTVARHNEVCPGPSSLSPPRVSRNTCPTPLFWKPRYLLPQFIGPRKKDLLSPPFFPPLRLAFYTTRHWLSHFGWSPLLCAR